MTLVDDKFGEAIKKFVGLLLKRIVPQIPKTDDRENLVAYLVTVAAAAGGNQGVAEFGDIVERNTLLRRVREPRPQRASDLRQLGEPSQLARSLNRCHPPTLYHITRRSAALSQHQHISRGPQALPCEPVK
ncbi:MAG TPA: hypothetical protein VKF35_03275 [Hyphomicrobiaceae bacterium]|nr:hypothetical protein [Hyphomicrobiaceae bacterium]